MLKKKKKEKKEGEGLVCGGRGLSKGDVWVVGGANAQDPQGWKRPWELLGVGFMLKEQKGPRRTPHPWSQRARDLTCEPSRLPGLKWAGQTPYSPLLLLLDGSSRLPLLISPQPPSYAPKDPQDLEGALDGRGLAWELSRLPGRSLYLVFLSFNNLFTVPHAAPKFDSLFFIQN